MLPASIPRSSGAESKEQIRGLGDGRPDRASLIPLDIGVFADLVFKMIAFRNWKTAPDGFSAA